MPEQVQAFIGALGEASDDQARGDSVRRVGKMQ